MAKVVCDRFIADREWLIDAVKEAGQYIIDNADDLVGNNRKQTGFDIVLKVDVDSVPVVELNRRMITAGWNGKRVEYFGEIESDDSGIKAATGEVD